MSAPTEDDLDNLPEAELLALPGEAIPSGRLTAFFTRRAEILYQHEPDELAFERSGDSARHFLIFPDTDPKQRQQREQEARRRAWLAELEMLEYGQRTDRLLAQIEDQQRVIEKRRKEIEDNAIRRMTAAASIPTAISIATSRAGSWMAGTVTKPLHSTARNPTPKRHGARFDPDRFSFLEGRASGSTGDVDERIVPPLVPDGTIHRALEKLLLLDGERISYRALDVCSQNQIRGGGRSTRRA